MLLVIVIGLVVIAIINTNMAECSLLAIKSASAADKVLILIICTLYNTLTFKSKRKTCMIMTIFMSDAYLLITNKYRSVIENVIGNRNDYMYFNWVNFN